MPWRSSHIYAKWTELLDSNRNVEVQTVAKCKSGNGGHPTWPRTQGNTVSRDGTCIWQLAMIGTQLATGSGSALDTVSPEFFPGAGHGDNNGFVELANAANLESSIQKLEAFTFEFYVDMLNSVTSQRINLLAYSPAQPMPNNHYAVLIQLTGSNGSCSNNCLLVQADISGSTVQAQASISAGAVTPNVTHHVALTYDGTMLRAFLDGSLVTCFGIRHFDRSTI